MRLLVVGANGLLGSNVVAGALRRDWSVAGTYHTDPSALDIEQTRLDLRNVEQVSDVCAKYDPTHVVNCAAMTDVDACEDHPERARTINAEAPGVLAECAAQEGAEFVHVSTDYVFDGAARRPYTETHTPDPVQTYGRTKLAGEEAVLEAHENALVPRLSFVYGFHRSTEVLTGFPGWVADRLANGTETPLFTDQYVTPTRAGFAAECILDLCAASVGGILNVACRECVRPYDVGRLVADELGYDHELLRPGRTTDTDRPAERPTYTCLATDRLEEVWGQRVPNLASELQIVL